MQNGEETVAVNDLQQSPEFQSVLQELLIRLRQIRPLVVAPLQFQTLKNHRRKISEFRGEQI